MARRTVRSEAAAVLVVFAMTVETRCRRRRKLRPRLMTRRTRDLFVSASQRIIRKFVIEIVPIEHSQRRVATFVLRMTLRARRGPHARVFSVVADSLQDLLVDRLVTRAAQLRLAFLVKCDVTIPAVVTQLLVLLVQVAWRHHAVENVGSASILREKRHESQQERST